MTTKKRAFLVEVLLLGDYHRVAIPTQASVEQNASLQGNISWHSFMCKRIYQKGFRFEKGFRFAPTRIYDGGEAREDVIDLLRRNGRFGYSLIGDMNAQVAAR